MSGVAGPSLIGYGRAVGLEYDALRGTVGMESARVDVDSLEGIFGGRPRLAALFANNSLQSSLVCGILGMLTVPSGGVLGREFVREPAAEVFRRSGEPRV